MIQAEELSSERRELVSQTGQQVRQPHNETKKDVTHESEDIFIGEEVNIQPSVVLSSDSRTLGAYGCNYDVLLTTSVSALYAI